MKKYALCLGIFLFFACSRNMEEEAPADLLNQKKMAAILMDIHLTEAEVSESRYYNPDSARLYYMKLEEKVFKKHKVDSTRYFRSYRYYAKNLNQFEEIYTAVADKLHLLDSMQKPDPPQNISPDTSSKKIVNEIKNTQKPSLYETTRNKLIQEKLKKAKLKRKKEGN